MPKRERILGGSAAAVASPTQGLEGLQVSLNLPLRAYYKLPDTAFELTKAQPTGRLPNILTDLQRRQLARALHLRELIPGTEPLVRRPQHPEAIKHYLHVIQTPGMRQEVIEQTINGLVHVTDGDPRIGNYTRFEVLDMMFEVETKGAARGAVLEYLAKAKEFVPGPEKARDEPAPVRKSPGKQRTAPAAAQPSADDIASL